ncbi:hypothetical protein JHK86_000453 [Glycine max]|nr:hypothetical protein JHK86_000453 [Glycine max]
MAKPSSADGRTRSHVQIFIVVGLCCFFYILGAWQRSGFGKGDSIALEITKKGADCNVVPNLSFDSHHGGEVSKIGEFESKSKVFEPCDSRYIDYTPCQDQRRAMTFPRENMNYRERHCPPEEEKLHCMIPAPKGYVTPFPWPKSRDYVPYANAPYKSLTVEKAIQNWIQYEGNVFRFPGGGTQFPQGADRYIDQLASVIPIKDGTVRTALDTGCGCILDHLFADGMYMMEVDRVLRPGGYWVLSGPPINWKVNYKAWQRSKEDLEEEQRKIEETAKLLCWEKKSENSEIAIWQKTVDTESCRSRQEDSSVKFCESTDANDVWYKKMEVCITPSPKVYGDYKPFPERLYAIPPRIASGSVPGVSVETYQEDSKKWKKHVNAYKKINRLLDTGRYRNIMDMNAGLGSFAADIQSSKLWVMNVVPTIAEKSTLGVIYERGLIGIYHDWCEAFSTYPRTYDLIHSDSLFSLYKDKCDTEDILLEMDRILRPEGAVIIRDEVDVLIKVKKLVEGMRWDTKMVDHEDGPLVPEKVLIAVKQYWVANATSTQ